MIDGWLIPPWDKPLVCWYLREKSNRKYCSLSNRKCTSTRRLFKPWFIQYLQQHPTILWFGQLPHPLTASSVRVCCGGWLDRGSDAQSVGWNVTRNARICLTLTACRVSQFLIRTYTFLYMVSNTHTWLTNWLAILIHNIPIVNHNISCHMVQLTVLTHI